jgi:hypothetical protein
MYSCVSFGATEASLSAPETLTLIWVRVRVSGVGKLSCFDFYIPQKSKVERYFMVSLNKPNTELPMGASQMSHCQ